MEPAAEKRREAEVESRVHFAAERTLLAWVRTGLALMGFGFVVARFGLFTRELLYVQGATAAQRLGLSQWIGATLVALGVAVTVGGMLQHWVRLRKLARCEPLRAGPLSLTTVVAALLALLGLIMAVYLLRT